MTSELKDFVDEKKVFFGARESIKNAGKIEKILAVKDCRPETLNILKGKNMEVEFLEFNKKEIAEKLVLDFHCEVFGVKK